MRAQRSKGDKRLSDQSTDCLVAHSLNSFIRVSFTARAFSPPDTRLCETFGRKTKYNYTLKSRRALKDKQRHKTQVKGSQSPPNRTQLDTHTHTDGRHVLIAHVCNSWGIWTKAWTDCQLSLTYTHTLMIVNWFPLPQSSTEPADPKIPRAFNINTPHAGHLQPFI